LARIVRELARAIHSLLEGHFLDVVLIKMFLDMTLMLSYSSRVLNLLLKFLIIKSMVSFWVTCLLVWVHEVMLVFIWEALVRIMIVRVTNLWL